MFKNLSDKLGFTKQEFNVVVFLIITLIAGASFKYFVLSDESPYKVYDYSKEDKVFQKAISKIDIENSKLKDEITKSDRLPYSFKEAPLSPKSINLNTANRALLEKLPGVGQSTASEIIKFRNINGNFSSIDDLLKVRGIGKAKLEKLKPFIVI